MRLVVEVKRIGFGVVDLDLVFGCIVWEKCDCGYVFSEFVVIFVKWIVVRVKWDNGRGMIVSCDW